jgi:hypothetical protein
MGSFEDTFNYIQNKSIQVFFIVKVNLHKFLPLGIALFIGASFTVVQNRLEKVYFHSVRLESNSNFKQYLLVI